MYRDKAETWPELMARIEAKDKASFVEYQRTGLCQHCHKDKAEYPVGINPYHCHKCNQKTTGLIAKLQQSGGFVATK
jgi:hypothetical protein